MEILKKTSGARDAPHSLLSLRATMSPTSTANNVSVRHPSFAEVSRFWLKFGFISFGGPTAQIALLHGELVERKKWISESRFLHALNFCMLLPGPEAHQLAIYIGWLLHKIRGGVIAGTLFVLPSAIFLWGESRGDGDRRRGGNPYRIQGAEK